MPKFELAYVDSKSSLVPVNQGLYKRENDWSPLPITSYVSHYAHNKLM